MADTLVSARIPIAKKEAGVAALKEIGATTSDLINSAFDYVVLNNCLPNKEEKNRPSIQEVKNIINRTTVKIDWNKVCPDGDYKKLIQKRLIEDYEALS